MREKPRQGFSAWDDLDHSADLEPVRAWTREEAQALRASTRPISPWRLVAVQAAVGVTASVIVGWIAGQAHVAGSMLYGVSCVVLPSALLARGLSSALSRLSPTASAVSFVGWALLKLLIALVMLIVANKVMSSPNWPAVLAGLVLCISVHAMAPLWAHRHQS